ncbi:MAG: hypothetical protein AB7D46_05365 [Flavobacteriaceae bacterium]
MRKFLITLAIVPLFSIAQISNKIEGITINSPCELEYMRNLDNQNNYSCAFQDRDNKIYNYSATILNLFKDTNGLSENSLREYKKEFLKTTKEIAEINGEKAEYVKLKNLDALLTISYLEMSGLKFINLSVVFIYKNKSFTVNLTTNNLNKNAVQEKLINSISL